MTKKYNVELYPKALKYLSWPKDHLKSLIYSFFLLDSQVDNTTIQLGFTRFIMFIIVFIILISLGVLIALYFFRRSTQTAKSSNNWPSVVGEIVSSSIGSAVTRDHTYYEPIITYSYNVGGRDYQAKRIVIGQWAHSLNKKWTEQKFQQYPPGKSVTVYYDPNSPEMAVLEPGMNSQILMKWYGISAVGCCFGVPVMFFLYLILFSILL